MATTGYTLGTLVSMYVNGEKVANARSHDFNLETDLIETTNKDSGGWKTFLPGEHSGTISIEGVFEEQGSVGGSEVSFEDLMDFQLNRTQVNVKLTSDVLGDLAFVGAGYMNSLSKSDPNNDVRIWNGTFTFSGAITPANES